MRKTKVICTIGPACEDVKVLSEMCYAGMNVVRLNFSHGTHGEHQRKIDLIKETREKLGMPIPIMLDTKGPEYRIKTFENGTIRLNDGDEFIFTTEEVCGNESLVSVNYKQLMENLEDDKADLLFGIKNEVDFVAASFVLQKQDIADMYFVKNMIPWKRCFWFGKRGQRGLDRWFNGWKYWKYKHD